MPNNKNKCFPSDVPGSRIVAEYKSYDRWSCFGKLVGGMCAPFCCIGLVCWMPAKTAELELRPMKAIIDKYTVPVLDRLRIAVDREQSLFLRACMNVNNFTETAIYPETTLLDAICAFDERIKKITSKFMFFRFLDSDLEDRKRYERQVYTEYIKIGGNPSFVLYGLPEYICIIYEPTSIRALSYFREIAGNTLLSNTIDVYKNVCLRVA